ncbi:MAG: ABC transporter permease [Candidatus Bathyarchaeota archaeon]|nr:ABC transporter permease [Candidatus Bathyarchaeota archaeon]
MNKSRLLRIKNSRKLESAKRMWYRFLKSKLSILGLVMALVSISTALLASLITPHPEDVTKVTHFERKLLPPNLEYPFGTDDFGRDIFSRTIFGFQYSLMMAGVVLVLVVPIGVVLGLIAATRKGLIETVIMRIADIFIAVPALVLALAICSVLTPSVFNAMMAVSLMWWPWYARLTYNVASSLKNEYFVQAAELIGASSSHIMFSEILPNCLGSILTKVTLDVGWVILIGSSLSFVGLGAQPPTPDLGTMVAGGGQYMPDYWWISIFPAIAIAFIIMGFNLLGDGVRDMFTE